MRVPPVRLATLCAAASLAIAACSRSDADLSAPDAAIVARSGTREFDAARWRDADETVRCSMLASLFRTRRFVGAWNTDVLALLGDRTCYIDHEDEPCYAVVCGGRYYLLHFGVNHSDARGRVMDVSLIPRD